MITAVCPDTLGALKPTLPAPSLLAAVPRITARIWSPSARASDSRLSTTMPTPVEKTVPLACASNDRHRPSRLSGPPDTHG